MVIFGILMILTDTHAHLYVEQFDDDRPEMMKRAFDAGISRFFIPAIDSSYHEAMFNLQDQYPESVFLMMGLHPTSVKDNYLDELGMVKDLLDQHTFYAIGETGIDLYWDTSYLTQQQEAFKMQIQWAKEKDLPIVIHSRQSFDEIFEVLEGEKDQKLRGIFHCFTGTLDQAQRALSFNMKLGIGGVATFKNGKIDQYLNEIPLEHIVLETDAPYLAPTPYRGKRNESSYLVNILDKLVDIYNFTPSEIAAITTQNSKDVFRI